MLARIVWFLGTIVLTNLITLHLYRLDVEAEKVRAAQGAKLLCEAQLEINKVYTCDEDCREEQLEKADKARAEYIAYMKREGEWNTE